MKKGFLMKQKRRQQLCQQEVYVKGKIWDENDALDDGEDYSIQITDKRAKLDEDFNEKKFDPDYTVTGDGFGPKKGKTEKSKQVKTRKRVQKKKVTTKAYEWEEEKIKPMNDEYENLDEYQFIIEKIPKDRVVKLIPATNDVIPETFIFPNEAANDKNDDTTWGSGELKMDIIPEVRTPVLNFSNCSNSTIPETACSKSPTVTNHVITSNSLSSKASPNSIVASATQQSLTKSSVVPETSPSTHEISRKSLSSVSSILDNGLKESLMSQKDTSWDIGLPSSTPLRKTHHFTSPSTSSLSPTLNLSKSRHNGTDISSKNVSFAAGSLNEDDKEFFATGSLNEDEKEFEEEEEQFEPFDEDEEIFEQDITASSMASRRSIPYYLEGFSAVNFDPDCSNLGDIHSLQQIFHLTRQRNIKTWTELQAKFDFQNVVKLGEGTYAEVFNIASVSGDEVAVKVIPIASSWINDDESIAPVLCQYGTHSKSESQKRKRNMANEEKMPSPFATIPELVITQELSKLGEFQEETENMRFITSNFIRLETACVVQGNYPDPLLKAFHSFRKSNKKDAINGCPSHYDSREQLYMVIATKMGGETLSKFKFKTDKERISVFFQTAYSLVVAEEALEFEHRDLHNDNILIKRLDKKELTKTFRFSFSGKDFRLKSYGVEVSIIDYTLSRLKKRETILSSNLSKDVRLFEGKGESVPKGDYQYDVYRLMKTPEMESSDWRLFIPRTNSLWLHYLAKKLFMNKKNWKSGYAFFDDLAQASNTRTFLESQNIQNLLTDFL